MKHISEILPGVIADIVTDARHYPPPVVITLPLPPNRGNARWHWRKEARLKNDYKLRCTAMHHERPAEPLDCVTITPKLYVWNLRDDDNATASLKWAIDWLVDRQIILDDHPSVVRLERCEQVVDRKNQRLELEIVPR